MPEITIGLDHAQARVSRDRVSALVQGSYPDPRGLRYGWAQAGADSDIWIDPLTQTVMLKPAPLKAAWITTGTGIYARTAKSGFTFVTSSKWIETTDRFAADYWIEYRPAAGDSSEIVYTTASLAKNRGVVIGWFNNQLGGDNATYIECGFGNSPAAGVSLRIYPGGRVEVWKDAVFVGDGTLEGLDGQKPTKGRQFYQAIILPYRRKELLVLLSDGTAYRHVFDDIDEDDVDPTITPNAKFWFQIPKPSGAAEVPFTKIQFAPLSFTTSGTAYTKTLTFAEAPLTGLARTVTPYYDVPGYGTSNGTLTLVEKNLSGSFTANSIKRQAAMKLELTGDGTATRFFYATNVVFDAAFANTSSAEEEDLTPNVVALSLDVPEGPDGARAVMEIVNPGDYSASGILEHSNRPAFVDLGSVRLVEGVTEPAQWHEAISDEARHASIVVREQWRLLENYRFQDSVPLDGVDLADAWEMIAKAAGIPVAQLDIEDPLYTLPTGPGASQGDWSVLIRPGDTAAEWMLRLRDNYAGDWFMSFVPTLTGPELKITSPATLDDTPKKTLYSNRAAALAAAVPAADVWKVLYRAYDEHRIEPEANDVRVTGRDPRTRLPIQAFARDTASQNPTTAPSARPSNWVGEVRRFGWTDPALSSIAACTQAVDLLSNRLMRSRMLVEFESEFLLGASDVPLWKGDALTLSSVGDFRILGFSTRFEKEPNVVASDTWQWRPTRYLCELIAGSETPSGYRTLATSLAQVRNIEDVIRVQRNRVRTEFDPWRVIDGNPADPD